MSTSQQSRRKPADHIEYLIFGYFKEQERLYDIIIPDGITQICIQYFFTPFKFEHDTMEYTPKTRVIINNIECGRISYIGKVHFNDDIMYGISLDNKSEDGHNGTLDGIHYFDVIDGHGKLVPFSSIKREKPFIITNDDGQQIDVFGGVYGTIRFGEFLTATNIKRFKGIFKMNETHSGHHGVGLITPQFKEFYLNNNYNYGKNHSFIIYDSGKRLYLVTSEEFDKTWTNKHDRSLQNTKEIMINGSTITVEIDMIQKIATFKNNDDKEACFTLKNLPKSVALAFSFGGSNKHQITCIQQEFY